MRTLRGFPKHTADTYSMISGRSLFLKFRQVLIYGYILVRQPQRSTGRHNELYSKVSTFFVG